MITENQMEVQVLNLFREYVQNAIENGNDTIFADSEMLMEAGGEFAYLIGEALEAHGIEIAQ